MNNMLTEYVLKHSKRRDKELKYDFMPSLLEIIERPAHKAGTVIIVGIFTLLIAVIIWACVSEIDVVITSSGSVQPIGNLNVVKTYSGGTVKSINVTEGDFVEQGDVLIELDTESLEIDVNQLQNLRKILETQRDIYMKIIDGSDLSAVKISDYSDDMKPYIQAILDPIRVTEILLQITKTKSRQQKSTRKSQNFSWSSIAAAVRSVKSRRRNCRFSNTLWR